MKRICFLVLIIFFCLTAVSQTVFVAGADAATFAGNPYPTLKAAFDNINLASQTGNAIVITITGNTTETASASLNAGTWSSLLIVPAGISGITGNIAGALVELRGGDNVTIDGLNTSGNTLAINNSNTGFDANAIRFVDDASYNTIRHCNLSGSCGALTSSGTGVVYFSSGLLTGNDFNTIDQCNISASSGGNPINGIFSICSSALIDNNSNTISFNNISDYFNADGPSNGINIGPFSTAWTIRNNTMYQTATRTYTTANTHSGILITAGNAYTILNNFIGFSAPNQTGTTNMIGLTSGALGGTFPGSFTNGSAVSNATRFIGINCAFAGSLFSSIQNNTIGGIALYTGSSASANAGVLCGIAVTAGNANIGNLTGNTIGSTTGLGSLYAASTSAGAVISGIYCTTPNTILVQNNKIGGIDVSGTTLSRSTGFKGIDIAGTGTFTVSNNSVGNATANNIRTGFLLTGASLSNTATTPTEAFGGGAVTGIVSSVTGATLDITNNIIQGMLVSGNSSTYTGILSTGTVTTTMNINANQVGNAVTNAVTFPFATSAGVFAINIFANASGTISLSNNSIYGITCPGANAVSGIISSGGTSSTTLNINNNSFINNVINGVAVSTPMIGIRNSAIVSTLNITGNIIRSNSSTATTDGFTGIQNSAAVVNTININNNQLGNASGGAIAYSAATTGTLNGISNTSAANTTTVNINSNSLDGISVVNCGSINLIQNTAANAVAVNINGNQLGTATGTLISFSGIQTSQLSGINNPNGNGGMAISIQNNNFNGIVNTLTGTGSQQYINCQASAMSTLINSNTFTNLSINSSGLVYLIFKGGSMNAGATSTVSNNSIVGSFSKTAAGGILYFFYSSAASVIGSAMTQTGNNFSNVAVTGNTQIYGWYNLEGASTVSAPVKTITGNIFTNIGGGTGVCYIITVHKGENINCSSNTISNISTSDNSIAAITISSTGGLGTHSYSNNNISNLTANGNNVNVTGITCAGAADIPVLNISNNIFTGFSTSGNDPYTYAIRLFGGNTVNVNGNEVYGFTGTGIGNVTTAAIAVDNFSNDPLILNVFHNRIYNLEESGAANVTLTGIELANAVTCNTYNNFISDLRVPATVANNSLLGISVYGTLSNSVYNLYYNSVYLNASSTNPGFGSCGIYHFTRPTATTGALNMINNIIVNTSTPGTAGVTAAYRRSNTNLSNYATTSDYNLFYAGTPSSSRVIFYDGSTWDQTLAAFKTRVNPREANSISLMPNFVSATDLHLTDANCSIDGKGKPVAITIDIDNETRDVAAPDIGADEFTASYGPALAGVLAAAVCDSKNVSLSPTVTTYATNVCDLIAKVLPSGGNPVSGKINACVTLDGGSLYFNGEPYVQRHYDIEPANTPATATATITLYFTDQEFKDYNTNNFAWPKLPTSLLNNTDPNRANVRVTQFHGTPTGGLPTTTPGNYTDTRELITPGAANVFWNGSYWEVTFNVTGFSGFYLHTTLTNAPLPIIVNYLTGRRQGANHLLSWKVTCTTSPSATMTLERSADSRNFSGLYTITANAARCNQPFDYTDANPLKGINYYRLKIVDADGKVTYSSTVALLNADKGFDIISVAPNPVIAADFKLNVTSAKAGKMEIAIFDMQGRLINRQTLNLIAGYNSMPVNVANLSSGTYTIKGSMTDGESKVIRFVKQ